MRILASMSPERQRGRWSFVQDGHHFYGLFFSHKMLLLRAGPTICLWALLLQAAQRFPRPAVSTHWEPVFCSHPPLMFLCAEGLLSLPPAPVLHWFQRKLKLSLLSHLPSSKHFPPSPPRVGGIILSHPSSYFLIPRTRGYGILHGKREFADVLN